MASTWTNVAKPTSSLWTGVAKPAESSVVTSVFVQPNAAQPFGLLMALTSIISTGAPTSSVTGTSVTSGWTDIAKPTSSVWTLIAKPTT